MTPGAELAGVDRARQERTGAEPAYSSRRPIALLPVELNVAVPVREFRVRNLLALDRGQVIETQWGFVQTGSPNDVQAAGQEIAEIRGEVMTLANTSYQGQYIFAGTQTASAPFSTSMSTNPAKTSYSGDSNLTYLRLPNGQKIQLNVPGNQIFQGPGVKDVFAALNNLIADNSSGTVNQAQAATDIQALTTALNYVSQQRVLIDNSITSLAAASEAVTNEKTQLTVAQTNLMQADVAEVATRLLLPETQQSALQAVIVHLSSASNSLFSKL